ncbi:MAG: Do family serine endopeptidase [Micavibrio aeruginosavorus]|uniref:Do family serine endopeptidase n=1 Tax=Micavibrio aeruginosavorus TaxID=349221 RepID=A0A7T5R4V6_9BACT|nr:MAG: Do family serine endopeptidase [Micavibrio aeruginosavorus]
MAAHAEPFKKTVPQDQAGVQLSFAPLVKKVAPAVVNIYTTRTITRRYVHPFMDDPFFSQFFGDMPGYDRGGTVRRKVEGALGSGVIVSPDGLVVTNAHVVKGADEIKVILADGREFSARVSLKDEPSDLALLRVDTGREALPHAELKPSETLEVGDLVLAIGNPFGVGQTVTSGIISALARSSLDINDYNFFIQTDAAINPGNSGGPLVSMNGGVIGINTAIFSQSGGSLGIGFAIPSEMVQSVIAAEAGGSSDVVRPWLGVSSQAVTAEIADSLGLSKPRGTLISDLHSASPLRAAGVKVGDVLVMLNGHEIRDPSEMKFRMATVKIGDTAVIGYLRGGKVKEARVKAIAPPEDPPRDQTTLTQGIFKGVTVANINPAVAHELGLPDQDAQGVVVMKVEGDGYGTRLLRKGDKILNVSQRDIKDVESLKKTLMLRLAMFSLVINRNGQIQQIAIR